MDIIQEEKVFHALFTSGEHVLVGSCLGSIENLAHKLLTEYHEVHMLYVIIPGMEKDAYLPESLVDLLLENQIPTEVYSESNYVSCVAFHEEKISTCLREVFIQKLDTPNSWSVSRDDGIANIVVSPSSVLIEEANPEHGILVLPKQAPNSFSVESQKGKWRHHLQL